LSTRRFDGGGEYVNLGDFTRDRQYLAVLERRAL
jgi:hypothetical protein